MVKKIPLVKGFRCFLDYVSNITQSRDISLSVAEPETAAEPEPAASEPEVGYEAASLR